MRAFAHFDGVPALIAYDADRAVDGHPSRVRTLELAHRHAHRRGRIVLAAIVIYVRGTQPHGRAGRYGFWPMILVLTVLWLMSLRGDPPPSLAVINPVFVAVVLSWAEWTNRARPVSG